MNLRSVFFSLIALGFFACQPNHEKNFIQFVDQQIGTGVSTTLSADGNLVSEPSNGQTIIGVSAPFGMTQWTPQLQSGQRKCEAPYYYGNVYTEGFRATHWINGACEKDYGSFAILPTTLSQEDKFLPNRRATLSLISYEDQSPAYLSVGFPNEQLLAEITGTERCGFFRFSWLTTIDPVIMITINNDYDQGYIEINLEKQEIVGYNPVSQFYRNQGEPAGIAGYFVARFDQKFESFGTFGNFDLEKGSTMRKGQRQAGAYVSFKPENNAPVLLKVGTSFTSIENARKNLEKEITDWDFYEVRSQLEKKWNNLLGTIEIETPDSLDRVKFYTALYRTLLHPRLMSDTNGDYPVFGSADSIGNNTAFDYYDDFLTWNTSRAQMPLLSLVAPRQYHHMVLSLLQKAKDGGWMPSSPLANNYTLAETGDFSSSIIVDAAMKGFDFDYQLAYEYLKKNALELPTPSDFNQGKGRPGLEAYIQNGYIPLEEQLSGFPHPEAQVSRTLEYSYNDWCLAQLATKLKLQNDADVLNMRAESFTNVFDEENGWMNGRFADGSFIGDFDPDQPQKYFDGKSSRQYSWFVPHQPNELIEMMGGQQEFVDRLKSFLASANYVHSDANTQHIAYLFNYAGSWNTTQEKVKEILERDYTAKMGGLSGHENAGQLSAWYVFSSMGFYPDCPGSNSFQLSSPIFEKVTLHLDKNYYPGQKLEIKAGSDAKHAIFSKVEYNGLETGTTITFENIQKGGTIGFIK